MKKKILNIFKRAGIIVEELKDYRNDNKTVYALTNNNMIIGYITKEEYEALRKEGF